MTNDTTGPPAPEDPWIDITPQRPGDPAAAPYGPAAGPYGSPVGPYAPAAFPRPRSARARRAA